MNISQHIWDLLNRHLTEIMVFKEHSTIWKFSYKNLFLFSQSACGFCQMPWVMWCLSPKDRTKGTQVRDERRWLTDDGHLYPCKSCTWSLWDAFLVSVGASPHCPNCQEKFADVYFHGVCTTMDGDRCPVLWGSWSLNYFSSVFLNF